MDSGYLCLSSASLLSKWGFDDGDMPEIVEDYVFENGIDVSGADWRDVLCLLVERHLLPEIRQHHMIEVERLSTIHNPIRATHLDGRKITAESYDDVVTELSPESVSVPMAAVVAALAEVSEHTGVKHDE
jgi:hypothetical protein